MRPLALVEPNAHRAGGHWGAALAALAAAARDSGRPTAVVAVHGILAETADALAVGGVAVLTRPSRRDPVSRLLLVAARFLTWAERVGRRRRPTWHVPYQWGHAAGALVEAASLRIAARWAMPAAPAVVILSAREVLAGTVAWLSGIPHARVVHEVVSSEGPVLARVESRLARPRRNVLLVCPTEAVAAAARAVHPEVATVVRAFALDLEDAAVTEAERVAGRARLGVGRRDPVAVLIGGWRWHKDVEVVAAALERGAAAVHVVVAGTPLDHTLLTRMRAAAGVRLHVFDRALAETELRELYAAADVSIVSRRPGVGKESGLVMDGPRYRVPLLVSDGDPSLIGRLAGRPWVRVFPAGDATALAAALDDLAERPLPRPGPGEGRALGMATPAEAISALAELAATAGSGQPCQDAADA